MRVELTKQEYRWLADLARKAKMEAAHNNEETPHPLFELRRENMADLEAKINEAIARQMQREGRGAR
jgi:hypothetical protein